MSAIIYPTWATNTAEPITQVAHGFSVGQQLAFNGTWVLADANDRALARIATVAEVIDVDRILIAFEGTMSWPAHGLTVGTLYYLSESAPGDLQVTPPIATGTFQQPCVLALTANRVRLIEYVVAQGSGSSERILQAERDFGGPPATNGNWALLQWNTGITDARMRYTALCKISIEHRDASDVLRYTSFYHMYLSLDGANNRHSIKMLAYSSTTNRVANNWLLCGNTAAADQTNLVINNKAENDVTKWRVIARLDESGTNNPVDALRITSIGVANERARWSDGDPIVVADIGDLGDVDVTGVS